MTNLRDLPPEIIDIIIHMCCEESTIARADTFLKYNYLPGRVEFLEYSGDMQNFNPHGRGRMVQNSCINTVYTGELPSSPNKTTGWIYEPILHVFKDWRPTLKKL